MLRVLLREKLHNDMQDEELDTDTKLALIASALDAPYEAEVLLDALLENDGDVGRTVAALSRPEMERSGDQLAGLTDAGDRRAAGDINEPQTPAVKRSNPCDALRWHDGAESKRRKLSPVVQLHTAAEIERHLPCTLIEDVLPADLADRLLRRMLRESEAWQQGYFKLFDRTVTSPHTSCFYLRDEAAVREHAQAGYIYNGAPLAATPQFPAEMEQAYPIVVEKTRRWLAGVGHLFDGTLPTASARIPVRPGNDESVDQPGAAGDRDARVPVDDSNWLANVAFSNLYKGAGSGVGYHADQLSYLGPLATIASLSLGEARRFRLKPTAPGLPVNVADAEASAAAARRFGAALAASPAVRQALAHASKHGGATAGAGAAVAASVGVLDGDLLDGLVDKTPTFEIALPHNSLLLMGPGCQERFKHAIWQHGAKEVRRRQDQARYATRQAGAAKSEPLVNRLPDGVRGDDELAHKPIACDEEGYHEQQENETEQLNAAGSDSDPLAPGLHASPSLSEQRQEQVPVEAEMEPVPPDARINITYRHYRPAFQPSSLPRCRCGIQAVLRSVSLARSGLPLGVVRQLVALAEDSHIENENAGGDTTLWKSTAPAQAQASAPGGFYSSTRYFWQCDGDKRPLTEADADRTSTAAGVGGGGGTGGAGGGSDGCGFFQYADIRTL